MSLLVLAAATTASAATIGPLQTAKSASDQQCAVTGPASSFPANAQQVFVRFVASAIAQGESLQIEWLSPSQEVAQSASYDELPAAGSLCFVSQMPIAGYAAGAQPGTWTVRVVANGTVLRSAAFQIVGDPKAGGTRIQSVRRSGGSNDFLELTIEGTGFVPGSVVHVAQFTRSGGWQYVAAGLASVNAESRLVTRIKALPAGQYVAVLKDPSDRVSNSSSFVVTTGGAYKLPLPANVPWRVSQGPNGGFSHWGRTAHAFDIAPAGSRCVVAMRAGIVHAFDFGYGQTPHLRIFGNYITIQHDNGEYSHYAHLQTGTFAVKTGQRVEQGQALAMAGNSGYSFGTHLHVQVTRSFQIASDSVPFEFEDLPNSTRHRGPVISSNLSPLCDCQKPEQSPVMTAASVAAGPQQPPRRSLAYSRTGSVPLADWWDSTLRIQPGTRNLEVVATATNGTQDVDVYLTSPSGRQYTSAGMADDLQISQPEPGIWRLAVQGVRTNGEAISFRVEANTPLR